MKFLLILLGILKWLGIILLALLILILLIVLVVMLSPIKYQLAGEKKEEISGTFGVSWLFGAVKVDGGYTPAEQLKLKVKVLWFTLMGGEEKPEKKKKPKKAKKKKEPKTEPVKQPDLQAAEKTEPKKEEKPAEEKKQEVPKQKMKEPRQAKTVRRVQLSEIEEKPPTEETEIVLLDEDADFFTGEEEKTEKKEKIPPIVKEIWSIEDKKGIFKALGKLLKRLMKGILPGDLFVKATIGTGDPTTTGYVLALAGMLTAKFGNDIQVKGDFTKATAGDMEVRVKGKIVLGKLVWAVLAFALTKPVRKAIFKMIKFLRKKDKD